MPPLMWIGQRKLEFFFCYETTHYKQTYELCILRGIFTINIYLQWKTTLLYSLTKLWKTPDLWGPAIWSEISCTEILVEDFNQYWTCFLLINHSQRDFTKVYSIGFIGVWTLNKTGFFKLINTSQYHHIIIVISLSPLSSMARFFINIHSYFQNLIKQ